MTGLLNRVKQFTAATGTGDTTLGSAFSTKHMTAAEAGAVDGKSYVWLYEQGNDFELIRANYTASGTVVARNTGTVLWSKIGGSVSNSTKMTLNGTATVSIVAAAEDYILTQPPVAKSSGFTMGVADRDTLFLCAGTFTLAFAAAATLGSLFKARVMNVGSGTITLDPNSSETVNALATLALLPGEACDIDCDGSAIYAAGQFGGVRYDRTQVLTSAQAAQARQNVYAAPIDAMAYSGMQLDGSGDVSQQNGTTQLTLSSDTETYVTDSWLAAYKNSGAVVKARQLAAASFPAALSGYSNAVELKATTALSSLANGDYAKHIMMVEGYRVARMGWGASGAQPLAYGFRYYNPAGGSKTIMVKLSNGDRSRCYYDEVVVAAGWNWVTPTGGSVPGDTSGTWNATNGIGLRIEVFSAGKAASNASTGAWGSTNTTATAGMTQNILDATNYAAVVTGLILLPGIELPPASRAALVMRPANFELNAPNGCKRFWQKHTAHVIAAPYTAGAYFGQRMSFAPEMRDVPSLSLSTVSAGNCGARSTNNVLITGYTIYATATVTGSIAEFVDDVSANARL